MSMNYSGLWADSDGSTDGQMHATTSTSTPTATVTGGVDGSGAIQSLLDWFGLSMQEAELVLQALYVAGTVGVTFALAFTAGGWA